MNIKKNKSFSHIIILISTNLFLILAFYFSKNSNQETTIPKNHKLLLFPIELFIPLKSEGEENYASLYDDLDNVVVKKALIHAADSIGSFNESNLHLIEVEDKDLIKFINFRGKKLRAFPIVNDNARRGQDIYEFTF